MIFKSKNQYRISKSFKSFYKKSKKQKELEEKLKVRFIYFLIKERKYRYQKQESLILAQDKRWRRT